MRQNSVLLTLTTGATDVLIQIQRQFGSPYVDAVLSFRLTGLCYEDIISPKAYAYEAIATLPISWAPPCPSIDFETVQTNVICNIINCPTTYALTIVDPEASVLGRSWSSSGMVTGIIAQYKTHNQLAFPATPSTYFDLTETLLSSSNSNGIYTSYVSVSELNGIYDFQMQLSCSNEQKDVLKNHHYAH